jgi:hypothetical protein
VDELAPSSATPDNEDVEMLEIAPVHLLFFNHSLRLRAGEVSPRNLPLEMTTVFPTGDKEAFPLAPEGGHRFVSCLGKNRVILRVSHVILSCADKQ